MESKYFKPGVVVHCLTEKSHLPMRNVTILEVQPAGVVGQQQTIADAPLRFYSFAKTEFEFVPSKKDVKHAAASA